MAETDQEIVAYVRQYRVTHPEQLEAAIRAATIEGHPAWEDVIARTSLIQYRETLWVLQTRRAGGLIMAVDDEVSRLCEAAFPESVG